jgi:hypothetical protein
MNPRLQQLVKQAGLDDDMFPIDEWDNPELEKFAELIVRECANVAANHEALDIYKEIREHFGVEE